MCARISSTRRRGRPFGPSALARYWRRCWAILRSTASSTTERLRAGRRMGNANRPQEPSFTVGIEEEYLLVDCETRDRSEEHTSELQSLMRISYAVCCLKKKKRKKRYASLIFLFFFF